MNFCLWWWCSSCCEFRVEQTTQLENRRKRKGLWTNTHLRGHDLTGERTSHSMVYTNLFSVINFGGIASVFNQAAPELSFTNASLKFRIFFYRLDESWSCRWTLPCLRALAHNISKCFTMPLPWGSQVMGTFGKCHSHLNSSKRQCK